MITAGNNAAGSSPEPSAMTPTELADAARGWLARTIDRDNKAEFARDIRAAADEIERLAALRGAPRAPTPPSEEEIAQAICKAAGWDWKDEATLNAGFMSCARAVLALSPKGSSEPSYPHQPGSPLFDGADAYEAHLADEAAQAMDNGRNTGGKSYLRHGITLPTSVDAVRLALCLRTPCTFPKCGCQHSIHTIVRVLAGGEPTPALPDDNAFRYLSPEPAPHELGISPDDGAPLNLRTAQEIERDRKSGGRT